MQIAFYILFGLLGVTGLLGFALFFLRRWGESVLNRMRDRAALRGEDSLRGDGFANFRGRLSDGYPLRGNAALLLTTRALRVTVLWPRRELEVPLERMIRIEITRSFMGRPDRGGFLIIHYTGEEGEDAIGLTLRRLPLWVAEIVKAARPYLKAVQNQNMGGAAGEGPPPRRTSDGSRSASAQAAGPAGAVVLQTRPPRPPPVLEVCKCRTHVCSAFTHSVHREARRRSRAAGAAADAEEGGETGADVPLPSNLLGQGYPFH